MGVVINWAPKELFLAVHPTGADGHSFFTMMYVYLTARIARVVFDKPICKHVVLTLIFTCLGGIAVLAVLRLAGLGTLSYLAGFSLSYQNPLVWGLSIALVMYFAWHAKCPLWVGRFCTFIAPSLFGIFLVHEVLYVGWKGLVAIEKLLDGRFHPAGVICLTAVVVFFVCLVIDLFRRLCAFKVKSWVNPWLERVDHLPFLKELRSF